MAKSEAGKSRNRSVIHETPRTYVIPQNCFSHGNGLPTHTRSRLPLSHVARTLSLSNAS